MTPITGIARKFFEACEAGKGWDVCKAYCSAVATFSAQAEPLAETPLWVRVGLMTDRLQLG